MKRVKSVKFVSAHQFATSETNQKFPQSLVSMVHTKHCRVTTAFVPIGPLQISFPHDRQVRLYQFC